MSYGYDYQQQNQGQQQNQYLGEFSGQVSGIVTSRFYFPQKQNMPSMLTLGISYGKISQETGNPMNTVKVVFSSLETRKDSQRLESIGEGSLITVSLKNIYLKRSKPKSPGQKSFTDIQANGMEILRVDNLVPPKQQNFQQGGYGQYQHQGGYSNQQQYNPQQQQGGYYQQQQYPQQPLPPPPNQSYPPQPPQQQQYQNYAPPPPPHPSSQAYQTPPPPPPGTGVSSPNSGDPSQVPNFGNGPMVY